MEFCMAQREERSVEDNPDDRLNLLWMHLFAIIQFDVDRIL